MDRAGGAVSSTLPDSEDGHLPPPPAAGRGSLGPPRPVTTGQEALPPRVSRARGATSTGAEPVLRASQRRLNQGLNRFDEPGPMRRESGDSVLIICQDAPQLNKHCCTASTALRIVPSSCSVCKFATQSVIRLPDYMQVGSNGLLDEFCLKTAIQLPDNLQFGNSSPPDHFRPRRRQTCQSKRGTERYCTCKHRSALATPVGNRVPHAADNSVLVFRK